MSNQKDSTYAPSSNNTSDGSGGQNTGWSGQSYTYSGGGTNDQVCTSAWKTSSFDLEATHKMDRAIITATATTVLMRPIQTRTITPTGEL